LAIRFKQALLGTWLEPFSKPDPRLQIIYPPARSRKCRFKSPFVKGDLGGFSGAYKIPPAPFKKGEIFPGASYRGRFKLTPEEGFEMASNKYISIFVIPWSF
jgi:hypothetical protein